MRLCIEKSEEVDPFYLDELLSFLGEEIKEYNWIFSDIQAHVFSEGNEITLTEFEKNHFIMSGSELYSFIKKYDILFIFGVIMCVSKDVKIIDINKMPTINENKHYWNIDYQSPVRNVQVEFGLFDTTVIIVTTDNNEVINKLKKTFPEIDTLESYLKDVDPE